MCLSDAVYLILYSKNNNKKETINKRCLVFVLFGHFNHFWWKLLSISFTLYGFLVLLLLLSGGRYGIETVVFVCTLQFICNIQGPRGLYVFVLIICLLMVQKYSNNCLLKHFVEHFWATCLFERCSTNKVCYRYYPKQWSFFIFCPVY